MSRDLLDLGRVAITGSGLEHLISTQHAAAASSWRNMEYLRTFARRAKGMCAADALR